MTYAINVPVGLFIEALIGPGWKRSIRRVWQAHTLYAAGAIATDLLVGQPRTAMGLNSLLVLIAVVVALANLWIFRDRLSRTIRAPAIGVGAIVLLLFVLNENLGRPVIAAVNLEPIGVFAFVVALGYGVVASVFRREAQFVAIQRELEMARGIQNALLPRDMPQVSGVEVAARYLSMTAVAGDLDDFVTMGRARVGILVADVSGHGVPAALVASMVKLAFAAQADHVDDPARVLTAMNRILFHHLGRTFVTAVYAVIDIQGRAITVANAGHPSLLVGRADRSVHESTERGLMLGVVPDASYANERLELRCGDRVFLYTDGIPEAQSPEGEFLDADRMTDWLASADADDAAQFAESVLRRLRQWRDGSSFDDDVTFVVARIMEMSPPKFSRP